MTGTPGVAPPTQEPNALVFVPSISRSWGDRSLRQLADDVVASMNQLSAGYTFTATPGDPLSYAAGDRERSSRRVSIRRIPTGGADDKTVAVVDLYELDYARALAAENENRPILIRAVQVLWSLFRGTRQFVGVISPRRQGKRRAQRLQLLFLFGVLALYAAFLGVLFATIVQMAVDALSTASTTGLVAAATATPAPSIGPSPSAAVPPGVVTLGSGAVAGGFFDSALGRALRLISAGSVLIWLVLPPKAKLKEGITNTATDFLTIDYYLRSGTNATRLLGDLNGLLDALRDGRAGVDYRRIDLCAYSLGSIVAFNALFPYGSQPALGAAVQVVHNFVSIGCPFDTIRLIRPDYFKGRRPSEGTPRKWFNLYTPNDILGSNFRNDDQRADFDPEVIKKAMAGASGGTITPPTNVPYYAGGVPQGQSFGDALFGGLRAHVAYWNPLEGGESTCFDRIVPLLYGADGTLGATSATG